jgi:hypothetical protein
MSIVAQYNVENDKMMYPAPTGPTFRTIVAEVAARAKERLPISVNGRVAAATKLVLAHDVLVLEDGTIEVGSSEDQLKTYHLVGSACECQDYPRAPEGWCKHRIAAGISKRVREVLAQTPAVAPAPAASQPAPLPEAPASCNVYVQVGGHKVQVTLRDTDEARMLARLQVLLAQYPPAPQPTAPERARDTQAVAVESTPVCQYHGPMKPSTKAAGTW